MGKTSVLFKVVSMKPDHVQFKPYDVLLEPNENVLVELFVDEANVESQAGKTTIVTADGLAEFGLQMVKALDIADMEYQVWKRKVIKG